MGFLVFATVLFLLPVLAHAETDVSGKVQLNKGRMFYNRLTKETYFDVSLTNNSQNMLLTPIKVVVDIASPSEVVVKNADGVTDDGKPYFEYSAPNGQLLQGASVPAKNWKFDNSTAAKFTYATAVWGRVPEQAVEIDANGGTLETPGGVKLSFPPDSLTAPEIITAVAVPQEDLPASSIEEDNLWLFGAVDFGPDGLEFTSPVSATFPLNTYVPQGTTLPLFMYDSELGSFIDSGFTCEVNANGLSCSGEISHFTIFAPGWHPGITHRIPDTGQINSYTETVGEDSDYNINPPSYTINGDGTVTDNNTNLIWQRQSSEGGTGDEASSYCENLNLAGYDNWRLPSKKELMSIVDASHEAPPFDPECNWQPWDCPQTLPTIDPVAFPDTGDWLYWTSTIPPYALGSSWYVSFDYGGVGYGDKSTLSMFGYARCVQGQSPPSLFYADSVGTVTDLNSHLTWQQQDDGTTRTWEEAIAYCENLSLAGYDDWRLPNFKELESITDDSRYAPAISPLFTNTKSDMYWSSTTRADYTPQAWAVDFYDGSVSPWPKDNYEGDCYGYPVRCLNYYARCVRDGQ